MLFFIDESWQTTKNKKHKVGVLSAISIHSQDFNEYSGQIYNFKINRIGNRAGNIEIKGRAILKKYLFMLERRGIPSNQLNLARDIFQYIKTHGTKIFASVTFEKEEIALECADINQLERPFFFLFERINQFMKENYPERIAKLVFDDRGIETNKNISKSVSNFFHKCSTGLAFDKILKTPLFGISTENVGIQISDMASYIIGRRFTGDRFIQEFFKYVKGIEFESKKKFGVFSLKGIKVIKKKRAGDSITQE